MRLLGILAFFLLISTLLADDNAEDYGAGNEENQEHSNMEVADEPYERESPSEEGQDEESEEFMLSKRGKYEEFHHEKKKLYHWHNKYRVAVSLGEVKGQPSTTKIQKLVSS